MINIFRTDDGVIHELDNFEKVSGAWINLTHPTDDELAKVADYFHIDLADISAALDIEESSRVAIEDNYTLILVDIPHPDDIDDSPYATFPLGIILANDTIITICSKATPIIKNFIKGAQKEFSTKKRMKFIYQILFSSAYLYQSNLRLLDKRRLAIEKQINDNIKDTDLIKLHQFESALVYFETSLRANLAVVDRLRRYERLDQYPEDAELLDDVEIEYRQAIEMATTYRSIIDGTRQLLSAVIDKRLNNAMKFLTSVTVVMAIPTLISGIYGMNVAAESMPFATSPFGFTIVCGIIFLFSLIAIIILRKNKML